LLLDRNVGVAAAALTSAKVVLRNPKTMILWGLIVACSLMFGFLAFVFGLALVVPVLGHSTWHLYRKAVERDLSSRPEPYHRRPQFRRYAAHFPAVLFSSQAKEQSVGRESLSAFSSSGGAEEGSTALADPLPNATTELLESMPDDGAFIFGKLGGDERTTGLRASR